MTMSIQWKLFIEKWWCGQTIHDSWRTISQWAFSRINFFSIFKNRFRRPSLGLIFFPIFKNRFRIFYKNILREKIRDLRQVIIQWAFPRIIFFPILKTDFVFSLKRFPQAVDITEPSVEMHFHWRFSINRLWKIYFHRHPTHPVH